jgi:hypothetical protein
MDLSNGISIGVLQTTPESAIVIKPQISGARVADPVKRGDKKLKPVGERLADGLILFEKTLFIQCKDMIWFSTPDRAISLESAWKCTTMSGW